MTFAFVCPSAATLFSSLLFSSLLFSSLLFSSLLFSSLLFSSLLFSSLLFSSLLSYSLLFSPILSYSLLFCTIFYYTLLYFPLFNKSSSFKYPIYYSTFFRLFLADLRPIIPDLKRTACRRSADKPKLFRNSFLMYVTPP
jgi:hypothetical protein